MTQVYNFEIHVKGNKKACYAVLSSHPSFEGKWIVCEYIDPTSKDYIVHFKGMKGESSIEKIGAVINVENELDKYTEAEILTGNGPDYSNLSLQDKAKIFNCEIACYEYCQEKQTQRYARWNKEGKIEKDVANEFKWEWEPEIELYWNRREFFEFEDWKNNLKTKNNQVLLNTEEITVDKMVKTGNGVFCYRKSSENNPYMPNFIF